MASNATSAAPDNPSTSVFIAIISPALKTTLIAHTFLVLLVPLIFALFYYSSPHRRRQPIFILNVITLVMAFTLGILMDAAGIHTLISPQESLPPTSFIAIGAIGTFQSILADLTLLLRLLIVYPLHRVGPRRFILVTFLPISLKIARIINITFLLVITANMLSNPETKLEGWFAYTTSPHWKIEWGSQIVDNAYASLMFLWTIHSRGGAGQYINRRNVVKSTLAYRFRMLFRIALSNFVIPTLSSIALLAISFIDVRGEYIGDVAFINNMILTFGVVFASVWVGKENQQDECLASEHHNTNKSMNDVSGTRTRHSVRTTKLSVGVVGSTVDDGRDSSREVFVVVDPEA